jgi:hypothetical protein
MTPRLIRWRRNDPREEHRQRWTMVHRVSAHAEDLTVCHRIIPAHPYMADYDDDIPPNAPRCTACARLGSD